MNGWEFLGFQISRAFCILEVALYALRLYSGVTLPGQFGFDLWQSPVSSLQ